MNAEAPRILACCRASIAEADILRFWLEHYRPKVDVLLVAALLEPGDEPGELTRLCNDAGAVMSASVRNQFHCPQSMEVLQTSVQQIQADWVIHADSDELLYELNDLRAIIADMEREGADHARAWMADRLAPGGLLRGLEGLQTVADLDAAFPERAAVTEKLAKGCSYKICLSRWPFTGSIHGPQAGQLKQASRRLTLEHFKWRAGLEQRLRKRVRDHHDAKLEWGSESERLLEELESYGRIRVERWPAPRRACSARRAPQTWEPVTLREIIAGHTHVITTQRRFDKLSATLVQGRGLLPSGVRICDGPDLRGRSVREKEAAVTAQHRELWEQCKDSGKPLCILEDDAWRLSSSHACLDDARLMEPGTVVFLGATYPRMARIENGMAVLTSAMGTHAYVVTPEAAAAFCAIRGQRVVDHITDAAIRQGSVRALMPVPEVFCQLDAAGDIAARGSFAQRHHGICGGQAVPLDTLLENSSQIRAQMLRSFALPRPPQQDGPRGRGDWRIGNDDAAVLAEIIGLLKVAMPDRELKILEFGPGRSTDIFLEHGCAVHTIQSHHAAGEGFAFDSAGRERLQVSTVPLHPSETTVPELFARAGSGYDLAFVDAPSWSPATGARDRSVTLRCALQSAATVLLHDAHSAHEQKLLFESALSSGRCIRRIDTKLGLAVLFRAGALEFP